MIISLFARAGVRSHGPILHVANNLGVPSKNVRLKYAHLHDSIGHSQFAPKGGNSQFLCTCTLHLSCSHTRLSSWWSCWSMMTPFLLLKVVSRKTGFVSYPGQTLSFRAYVCRKMFDTVSALHLLDLLSTTEENNWHIGILRTSLVRKHALFMQKHEF